SESANTGPSGSPAAVPAAISRLRTLPAARRWVSPDGIDAPRLASARWCHRPPVIRASPGGTGRSRTEAESVGAAGPARTPVRAVAVMSLLVELRKRTAHVFRHGRRGLTHLSTARH